MDDDDRLLVESGAAGEVEELTLPGHVGIVFSGNNDAVFAHSDGKLSDQHHHFSFASAIELAKKDSLPATKKELSVLEGNC